MTTRTDIDTMQEALKQAFGPIASAPEEIQTGFWDIISALRGPDFEMDKELGDCCTATIKPATTAVIRYHAFQDYPDLRSFFRIHVFININSDSIAYAEVRKSLSPAKPGSEWYHFIFHAQKAFAALGLKWDEVNQ